mgnify:CR=1 FL=1
MKVSDGTEKVVSVITWIAFALIVLVHLGILLAGVFYSSPEDVPVEFLNP